MNEQGTTRARPVLFALVGAVLGLVGARYLLVGSALSLLPWALVAFLIGRTSSSSTGAVAAASSYGFVLAFTFMTAGYQGRVTVATPLLPFALLGLLGAICATLLALATHRLTRSRSVPRAREARDRG